MFDTTLLSRVRNPFGGLMVSWRQRSCPHRLTRHALFTARDDSTWLVCMFRPDGYEYDSVPARRAGFVWLLGCAVEGGPSGALGWLASSMLNGRRSGAWRRGY